MATPGVAFEPRPASTITIEATTVSTVVRINDTTVYPAAPSVRVWNAGSEIVFIEFGGEDVEATEASSMPLPPGDSPYTFRPGGGTHIAAITHANSAVVYVTPGYGT